MPGHSEQLGGQAVHSSLQSLCLSVLAFDVRLAVPCCRAWPKRVAMLLSSAGLGVTVPTCVTLSILLEWPCQHACLLLFSGLVGKGHVDVATSVVSHAWVLTGPTVVISAGLVLPAPGVISA